MLVGIGVGITASFGFHLSVKESSDHQNVEQIRLSSNEVIYIECNDYFPIFA